MKTLFESSMNGLARELNKMRKGEDAFLKHYRAARQHAFRIEYLAKFLRKYRGNKKQFDWIAAEAKEFEDRLGRFDELDAMITFCREKDIRCENGKPAADEFMKIRDDRLEDLRRWMMKHGWCGEKWRSDLESALNSVDWKNTKALRHYTIERMAKILREVQDEIDGGDFLPKHRKSGYTMREVESKVHEARRHVRKLSMLMSYTDGMFVTGQGPKRATGQTGKALDFYAPLLKTKVAKSPFAELPRASIPDPVEVPRAFLAAITKYVDELGVAKDWAQNLNRLHIAGIGGRVMFDHLDPSLRTVFGMPVPFNKLVTGLLGEMKKTKIFAVMAKLIEEQE